MADHSITIRNELFGGVTTLWNAANWGAFLWGEVLSDSPVKIGKNLATETLTLTSALLRVDVRHLISESLASDTTIARLDTIHVISEALSSTGDCSEQKLSDGSGYNYIFPSNTINHESQALPSYTSGSIPSNTWTSGTTGTPVWS